MKLGLDVLIERQFNRIAGKRVGLLVHRASVDSQGRHALDGLCASGARITALFGPEHGIATKAQDMEPVESRIDADSNIPVHSLYGDSFASLSPAPETVGGIDILVIDLQDIGSRYYTYAWTAVLCMKACAAAGVPVIVCDRPNPLGGIALEGRQQRDGFTSFVGLYPIPVRHGMTIGEIARYVNGEFSLGCDLDVIPMEGWGRDMLWDDTGLVWINPSPNMSSFNAALLYPGMCLVEGTNISEGRGTDTPFEIMGAPFIDSLELIGELAALELPGIRAVPTSFIPTRQKFMGEMCNGVRWAVTDVKAFRPYLTGLATIWAINRLYMGRGFAWRTGEYEFVKDVPAIDLLTGGDEFRTKIDGGFDTLRWLDDVSKDFLEMRKKHLFY